MLYPFLLKLPVGFAVIYQTQGEKKGEMKKSKEKNFPYREIHKFKRRYTEKLIVLRALYIINSDMSQE